MTVYVVFWFDSAPREILDSVWSTREAAETYCSGKSDLVIEVWHVDVGRR